LRQKQKYESAKKNCSVEVGIFAFAFVLPGEVIALPNVGEAGLAACFGQRLLEAVDVGAELESLGVGTPRMW
jgi:hypothetical protein